MNYQSQEEKKSHKNLRSLSPARRSSDIVIDELQKSFNTVYCDDEKMFINNLI